MKNILHFLPTPKISICYKNMQTEFTYSNVGEERLNINEGFFASAGEYFQNSNIEIKKNDSGIDIISDNESDLYALVSNFVNNSPDWRLQFRRFSLGGKQLLEAALDSYDTQWREILGTKFAD